jgi:hypothetical protein
MVNSKFKSFIHPEEDYESINQKAYRLKKIHAAQKVNPNDNPGLLFI